MERKIKYAVLDDVEQIVVVVEGGNVATAHHNDEHIVINYYGNRVAKDFNVNTIWSELDDGIRSWLDLKEKQEIDEGVIMIMLHSIYGEVEFEKDISVECFDEEDLRRFLNKN
jgi:hypothetical protein